MPTLLAKGIQGHEEGARGYPAQVERAEMFIQSQTPHCLGHGVSNCLPGKQVKRGEWLKTHPPLSCICEDMAKQHPQPLGVLPCPRGQSEARKDPTGPKAELDSNLKLSELQL